MRISDWSSDVCSSDLARDQRRKARHFARQPHADAELARRLRRVERGRGVERDVEPAQRLAHRPDRKSVVLGKSVSVRVDLGGRRIIKKKKSSHKLTLLQT